MCCYEDELCFNKGVCVSASTVQERLRKVMPVAQASSVAADLKANPSSVMSEYATLMTNLPVPNLGTATAHPYEWTTTLHKSSSHVKSTCEPSGTASACEETKSAMSSTSASTFTSASTSTSTSTSTSASASASASTYPSSTTVSSPKSTAAPTSGSGASAADSLHVGLRVVCVVAAAVVGGVAFML
jgi:hypothetical protein